MKIEQLLIGQPFQTEFGIVGYSSVVLVQDGDRNILYDCGNRAQSRELRQALRERNLSPESITDLVISHLHFDHVGNLPMFPDAEILLSEKEWRTAGSCPDEYHDLQALAFLEKRGGLRFVMEGDWLSEGTRILSLPGHTEGLIGILAGEDTVLCSDTVKNRYELFCGIKPMSIDPEKSRQTLQRIRGLARFLYPGHDCMLELSKGMPDAPAAVTLVNPAGERHSVSFS